MQWFGPRMAEWYRKGSAPKREEGRAQTEARRKRERSTINMRGSKEAMVLSQNARMVQKRVGP